MVVEDKLKEEKTRRGGRARNNQSTSGQEQEGEMGFS